MSVAQMSPDTAWIVGSVITAAIMTGPAYMASRKARRAESTEHAELEHAETRQHIHSAVTEAIGPLVGRIEAMNETLDDLREWQGDHAISHAVTEFSRVGHPSLELRKGK